MDNKKIPTRLGVIIILIIAFTAGLFLVKFEEGKKYEEINVQNMIRNEKVVENNHNQEDTNIEISDEWTLVNHENFWHNPELFAHTNYNFPNIEFSYPSNWNLKCCGDMGHASEHFIKPSNNIDKSLPYIRITDYVLNGCPDQKESCSINETIKLSSKEKFNRLASDVPNEQILPKIELEKLNTSAFVYEKIERNGQPSKAYLINLGNDVIEISFVHFEMLNDAFINDFLNRIFFEK